MDPFDSTAELNPYQSPRVNDDSRKSVSKEADPRDLRRWRVYLAFHVCVVIATFVATMADTGYWRLDAIRDTGVEFLFNVLILLVYFPGTFLAVYVAPVIMLVLFARAFNHRDTQYAVAGFAELLLTGAQLFIAMPLYQ
jgi:hypothetical protein